MPRNEEGESELVLGNRQLLSVFFIVVILMGVCFTAGYIVGRNSTSSADAARARKGESAIVVDPTASEAKSGGPRSAAPGEVELREAAPVRTPAKPAPTERAPERAAAPPPEPEPARAVPEAAKPAPAASSKVREPEAGRTYIQVAAVGHPDAGAMVDALKGKGFAAQIAPGPSDTLFRVLVGPIQDSAEVNKQRTRLKELGFDPFVKRY